MTSCFLNGEFVEQQDASVSVRDRGFRFGDGVFETIHLENGVPYAFDNHMQRLGRGLAALSIDYDTSVLQALCHQLLVQNAVDEPTVLRIAVTRGIGGVGYMPAHMSTPSVLIETLRRRALTEGPLLLYLSSVRKMPSATTELAGAKTIAALPYILARMEATKQNCQESLMLGINDEIMECDSSNIFWVRGEVIYTPALFAGILPGTTRQAVIRLSPYQVIEGLYDIDHLLAADEVFITNAVRGVQNVSSIIPLRRSFESIEKTAVLSALLAEDRTAYALEHSENWHRLQPFDADTV